MLHNLRRNITLLLFCLFSICSKSFAKEPELPKAIQGVLDLRKENLQTDGLLLDGEWGFYWNQLLTPDEIKTNPGLYVSFPALWNNLKWKGIELPGQGYATYTLSILLPPNKRSLALDFPDVYTASKLYINGRLYAFSGIPGKTKETTKPRWVNQIVVLPENFDTLKLVLQIANFHHSRGGIVSSFRIGSYHKLFLKRDKQVAVDFIVTAALLMAGLFFFGLYLFGQHDKSILFFALFCITYSYRIVGTGFYALHAVFPDTSWWLNIHIEYLSLYLSIAFFALYTRYLYPDDSNKNILNTQVVLCGIFILITLIFPPVVFTQLIKPFLVIVFFYIGYAFYVFIKAVRNKRMGAGFALAGTGLILCISILINLQYFNFLHLRRTTELFGYISFFFLQSLVLSFRFAYSLKKAKQLAEQGLQVKSQFLSTMSHEIRTPLNSVIGMTHLLLRGNPREEQKEQLNILLFSAGNLLSIVNDILDFNKIEAGKIQFEKIETDIASIARNIISGLQVSAEDKGVKLRLELDPLLKVSVIGDPTRTSQVITNLIHNAIKFTNEGEIVLQIKVKEISDTAITLSLHVKDTGIGISAENQKMIFEQFSQADSSTSRRYGGTGLGLAICKRILEEQGSALKLKSEPGKGSEFYFTQTFQVGSPLKTIEKEVSDKKKITEEQRPLQNIHVLLVEDNELNILVTRKFLENWGARVDVAINGQEAIDKLDTAKHEIILMDMHMPVMDGYEATRILREKGVTVPIIALTASIPGDIKNKVFDAGANDIVIKPFDPNHLYRIILHYTRGQKE